MSFPVMDLGSTGRYPGARQRTRPARARRHFNTGWDAFADFSHVGNDADQFPFVFEARQDGKRGIQSCLVERSEPFVQKERIHPYVAARETRKTQCERETHNEGFAAREVLRRTDVAAAVVVDDVDRQRGLLFRREFVPVGEFHE